MADIKAIYKKKKAQQGLEITTGKADVRSLWNARNSAEKEKPSYGSKNAPQIGTALQDPIAPRDYEALRKNADFSEKSAYNPDLGKRTPGFIEKVIQYGGGSTPVTYEDLDYHVANKNAEAQEQWRRNINREGEATITGVDNYYLNQLTNDELSVYNYLYATEGKDSANEYIDSIKGELNVKETESAVKEMRELADDGFGGAALATATKIITSPYQGAAYLGQIGDYLDDGRVDPSDGYNRLANTVNAGVEAVEKKIQESGKWGGIGSKAYSVGVSMGNSLWNATMGGGYKAVSLAILGTEAAASTVLNSKQQGMSDDRSFALGTAAGLIEVITELIGLDALFDPNIAVRSVKQYILRNFLSEGSEEALGDWLNWAAESVYDAISDEREGELAVSYDEKVASGMARGKALWQTIWEAFIQSAGDFALGGISGGIMAGVGSIGVNSYFSREGRNIRNTEMADGTQFSGDDLRAMIEEGLSFSDESNAHISAKQAEKTLSKGKEVSDYQLGQLFTNITQSEEGYIKSVANDYFDSDAAKAAYRGNYIEKNDNLGQYSRQAIRLYNAAKNGTEINMDELTALSPKAKSEIYKAGLDEVRAKNMEGNENGKQLAGTDSVLEGTVRSDVQGAGIQSQGMASGTGRFDGGRSGGTASAAQGIATYTGGNLESGTKVTARSLGLSTGTDANVLTISEDTDNGVSEARSFAEGKGFQFVPFSGANLSMDSGEARGAYYGGTVYARTDAPDFKPIQIVKHEAMHGYIARGAVDVDDVISSAEKYGATKGGVRDLVDLYKGLYEGTAMTDEEILEEIVCDAAGGMDMFSEAFKKIDPEKAMAAKETFDAISEQVEEIENSPPALDEESTDPATNSADIIKLSYASLAEACGFKAELSETGERYWTAKDSGARTVTITEEDIKNSPVGALIKYAADSKFISDENYNDQISGFRKIAEMCVTQQDFAQSMAFVGSSVFTGIKSNADKQYGTTFDFLSICLKTQATVDAMSAEMVRLGRGLTESEIVDLYNRVYNSGNPVPCPECYVFSRWIGIGGLLDNMKRYQDEYGSISPEEVRDRYESMREKIESNTNGMKFGKAKGDIAAKIQKEFSDISEEIILAEEAGRDVTEEKREKLKRLARELTDAKAMTWIRDVYFTDAAMTKVNPRFRVPDEILFDLNAGEKFAAEYKEAWGFRTTQGAGYGKAITPYAEEVLGEGILGTNALANLTKSKAARANGTERKTNLILEQRGELNAKARDSLRKAQKKQKCQAFIGGQRFQSTSDARYELYSDYLLAALEMEAMHGMVQVYSKVSGAVPMFTSFGWSVNQSLMPKGNGLAQNGMPADTSVGGMNPDVARANRLKYESAGTITIGVNDRHIRAMFSQYWRDFIIPYHASGGKMDIVREFRRIQDSETGKAAYTPSCDYSQTQSEKLLPADVLKEQGYTDAEIADVVKFRDQRLAILTGNGSVDLEYVRAAGNELLADLYDSLHGGFWDGVTVQKGKCESQIYPNEYWDTSATYEESGRNTEIYLEYCRRLGMLHKFSGQIVKTNTRTGEHSLVNANGYNENGVRVPLTDLAYKNGNRADGVEEFFWKVLVDRRMYDNDGNYLPQKFCTINNAADFSSDFAKETGSARSFDPEKSKRLATEIGKGLTGNTVAITGSGKFKFGESKEDGPKLSRVPSANALINQVKKRDAKIATLADRVDALKTEARTMAAQSRQSSDAHLHSVDPRKVRQIMDEIGAEYNVSPSVRSDAIKAITENARAVQQATQKLEKGTMTRETYELKLEEARDSFAGVARNILSHTVTAEKENLLKEDLAEARKNTEDPALVEELDAMAASLDNPYDITRGEVALYIADELFNGALRAAFNYSMTSADENVLAGQMAQGRQDAAQLRKLREKYAAITDGLKSEINEQRTSYKERISELIRSKNEKIQAIHDYYVEMNKSARERRLYSKSLDRLMRVQKRLSHAKLPAATREMVKSYTDDIDFSMRTLTGKQEAKLTDVLKLYNEKMDRNSPKYDPFFVGNDAVQNLLGKLSKKHPSDLTLDEIEDLTKALIYIEKSARDDAKMFNSEVKINAFESATASIAAVQNSDAKPRNKFQSSVIDGVLTPGRIVHRTVGYDDKAPMYVLWKELEDGQRKQLDYEMKSTRIFDKWLEDKGFKDRMFGKKADLINIAPLINHPGLGDVYVTPDMICALYLHAKNDQNMRHISYGGATIPDAELYRKGKVKEAYDAGITLKLSRDDIANICSKMTPAEREFANAVSRYFNGDSRNAINAVSEMLVGYSIAAVENYMPINVDKRFIESDPGIAMDGTIEGMGMLAERTASAKPVYLMGLTSALKRSIQSTAKYVGLAIPVRNWNNMFKAATNLDYKDPSMVNRQNRLGMEITAQYGAETLRMLDKAITDIQNPARREESDLGRAFDWTRSNYAGAVLTMNPGVALKQAASLPAAAAVIGFKPIEKALTIRNSIVSDEEIARFTALLWFRAQGYSTTELGDIVSGGKNIPKALNWIQGVDLWTCKKIWIACMQYVKANSPALEYRSEAFMQETARVFNDCIEQTQPNYTPLQRGDILRSDNAYVRSMVGMFKTVPFQNFGILYDALGNYKAKKRALMACDPKNAAHYEAEFNDAKKKLANAVTSQLVSSVVFSAMSVAWNFVRGKYIEDDDDLDWKKILIDMGLGMVENGFGMIPFGSGVASAIEAIADEAIKKIAGHKVLGRMYYSDGDTQWTTAAIDTLVDLTNSLIKAKTFSDYHDALIDGATGLADFFGISASNVYKMAEAVYDWITHIGRKYF